MHSEVSIFLLAPEDLPRSLREWMDLLYPDDAWRKWFVETNRAFAGKSPQQALSVRHDRYPEELRRNVKEMVDAVYRVLSFVDVPYVDPPDVVYNEVVAAQVRVRWRVLSVEKNRRPLNTRCVSKTPHKLFSSPTALAFA